MNTITLPNGRTTTRLGFGCGPLQGGLAARRSRAVIDVAFEAGFRHFDVAPPYGLGLAEAVLGDALRGRRQDVTVTTKAGIARPRRGALVSTIRHVAKPIFSRMPFWKNTSQKARKLISQAGVFDAESVRKSLEESLSHLQTSCVDVFLLHELRQCNEREQLVEMLTRRKRAGAIGALGTGTTREDAMAIALDTPALGEVQQYRWDIFEPRLPKAVNSLIITHGAVLRALGVLGETLTANTALLAEWSASLDLDLAMPSVIGDLLVAAALAENQYGIVLVHSQQPSRIRRYAALANDDAWLQKGALLRALVEQMQQGPSTPHTGTSDASRRIEQTS